MEEAEARARRSKFGAERARRADRRSAGLAETYRAQLAGEAQRLGPRSHPAGVGELRTGLDEERVTRRVVAEVRRTEVVGEEEGLHTAAAAGEEEELPFPFHAAAVVVAAYPLRAVEPEVRGEGDPFPFHQEEEGDLVPWHLPEDPVPSCGHRDHRGPAAGVEPLTMRSGR